MKFVYQDKNVLVVEKPCSLVVHPDSNHHQGTILDLVKNQLQFSEYSANQGIVHRLDKPVSGLLLIARNLKTWQYLRKEMKKGRIARKYYALVKGKTDWNYLKVDAPLTKPGKYLKTRISTFGKKAITYLKVIKRWENQTLVECQLETGRTHQIRAHLKFIGHPIINDPLYYKGESKCIFLYSFFLSFYEPGTNKKIQLQKKVPEFFGLNY